MIVRLLFICFVVVSCSAARMTETVLYFGQSRPDGSMIRENEWDDFEQQYIRKVFVQGYSVSRINGRWQDTATGQMITEPTCQVTYYYKNNSGISRNIDSLRYWYQKLFHQQSVLRVDKKVKATF